MNFHKAQARWRQWLTDDEARAVAEIDAEIERTQILKAKRTAIANRAAQRAWYHRERPEQG